MNKLKNIFKYFHKPLFLYLIVFMITFLVFSSVLFVLYCAPFGNSRSLATNDAYIQYIDFFSYFKDVLAGQNDITYTFDKTLGDNAFAVFSYYLSSPLSLLVVFFDKTDLHSFIDSLITIKISLTAVTCAIFLNNRFSKKLHLPLLIALSMGYALCAYVITKKCNIMWLDGVYMLPIMALGVYKLIAKNRFNLILPVSIALAIIFNWYSGLIDCVFIVFWFILEYTLSQKKLKEVWQYLLKFIISAILGVAMSAAILLPTISALGNGARGSIDFDYLKFGFRSEIPSMVQNLRIGATDTQTEVSLFCGSISILGIMSIFISKHKFTIRKKVIIIVSLFAIYLIMCWGPLFFLFSLLKDASSYYTRFAYMGSFTLIFLSATAFPSLRAKNARAKEYLVWFKAGLVLAAIQVILQFIRPINLDLTYLFVIDVIIISAILTLYHRSIIKNNFRQKIVLSIILIIAAVTELTFNTAIIAKNYLFWGVSEYKDYTSNITEQIQDIKNQDQSFYRISQTSTEYTTVENLTANYNESLAQNYMSISGYTSSPDIRQLTFLNDVGYHKNGENFNITNDSVLATDSLLGIKYIMSKYEMNGLQALDKNYGNRKTYYNSYYLPMAFDYKYQEAQIDKDNPFITVNNIYSSLAGKELNLFFQVNFKKSIHSDYTEYDVSTPENSKNYILYGNLAWVGGSDPVNIQFEDGHAFGYNRWLAPSVFYIPSQKGASSSSIKVSSTSEQNTNAILEQFYALDLDALKEFSAKTQKHEAKIETLTNQHVVIKIDENHQDTLFTSIPYHKNWRITVNNEKIAPQLIGDCLMAIPLVAGENIVEFEYSDPTLKTGFIVSCIATLTVVCIAVKTRVSDKQT